MLILIQAISQARVTVPLSPIVCMQCRHHEKSPIPYNGSTVRHASRLSCERRRHPVASLSVPYRIELLARIQNGNVMSKVQFCEDTFELEPLVTFDHAVGAAV